MSPSALTPTDDAVRAALATVDDPEIHKPITDLGMVKSVDIDAGGAVAVTVYLTVSGCPMRDEITGGSPRRSAAARRHLGTGHARRHERRAAP